MGILAWVDIEACGLADDSPILEIGLVVTSQRLTRITAATWLVTPPNWPDLKADLPDVVLDMHTANGLVADLDAAHAAGTGQTLAEVEREMIRVLRRSSPGAGRVTLAGSGVASYDHRLFRRQMPDLTEMLNYYTYDIGMVRRFAGLVGIKVPEVLHAGDKTHRAQDDIEAHLSEAAWFLDIFRSARSAGLTGGGLGEVDDSEAAWEEAMALVATEWDSASAKAASDWYPTEALGRWVADHAGIDVESGPPLGGEPS